MIRKERWTLSPKGKFIVLSLAVLLAITGAREVVPFLSVTHPVHSDFLIVEGWIGTHVMTQVACEFKRNHYQKLLLVRGSDDQYKTDDERDELIKNGVQPKSIEMVSSLPVQKDRTYHLALAVRNWFMQNGITVTSLNAVTLGPHARRSRLMFEKAFGNSADVGIVALDDPEYDGEHWWRSSEGVREVLGEAIAYIYARLYFVWT
jgi:hypothetical protein